MDSSPRFTQKLPTIKVPYFTILFHGGWGFPCIGRIHTASSIFRTSWRVTNLTKDSQTPPKWRRNFHSSRIFVGRKTPKKKKHVHVAKGFYWKTTIIPPKKTIMFLPNLVLKPFIPWFVIKQKNITPTFSQQTFHPFWRLRTTFTTIVTWKPTHTIIHGSLE